MLDASKALFYSHCNTLSSVKLESLYQVEYIGKIHNIDTKLIDRFIQKINVKVAYRKK